MCWSSRQVQWLVDTGQRIRTKDGQDVVVWELQHVQDQAILSEWARHFRNHYCRDTEINFFRHGTGLSRADYLNAIKFPDPKTAPGPSIRAGDFAEILVADYLEFVLSLWVPRTRYADKTVRNESEKGCDVIGFYQVRPDSDSRDDALYVFEVKAQFSGKADEERLQKAVNDSVKDQIRRAESLNAIKQRLWYGNDVASAQRIERFQNPSDRPYKEISGAAAVLESAIFDEKIIAKTVTKDHPNVAYLALIIIKGAAMMDLVHELYRRAADEA